LEAQGYGKQTNKLSEEAVREKTTNGGKTKMLFDSCQTYFENRRLRKIAKEVRKHGRAPAGVKQDEIFKALRLTAPKNNAEVWGVLTAVVEKATGGMKQDYGVVSVREVTQAFTKRLVDCMCDSAVSISCFNQHKMGAGSTAETDTQTALVTAQEGSQSGNATQTHGASSSIYQSVGTLTAGSSYGCREHGVFNASTGGVLLDRSVVTNIDLNTDDIVTWTYSLTVNAGG
jgi:hypothetical protein